MTQSETSKAREGEIVSPWFDIVGVRSGRLVPIDFQGVLRQDEPVRFRLYDESPWLRFQQARQGSE